MVKKLEIGEAVRVTDPDGEVWVGKIACPSVLWANWYVVHRLDRKFKNRNYVVHISDMEGGDA